VLAGSITSGARLITSAGAGGGVGGAFAILSAYRRTSRERRLAQLSRVAEVAQRAILRPIVGDARGT
jgi:hypothetical protein